MSVTSTPKGSDLELDALEAVARRAEAASEDGWLSPLSPEGEDLWNELDPPTILSLISAARKGQGEWRPIESAPHACHILACRFDQSWGEWHYAVVMSPPSYPFTHWMPLPSPPPSKQEE